MSAEPDPGDFVEFASARTPQLFRSAYLLTGDYHLAEDLVQTTLGKLYRGWKRIQRAENPVAYAHTVLARTYISYRRLRRSTEAPTQDVPEQVAVDSDPALRMTLLGGLEQLSVRDRTVLVLRFWEDRSVEDTAQMLGVRPGAVRSQTMRALGRLRELLGNDVHVFADR
ncbi:SigE family RNA polymerase sigma factor [Tenggerimyces flavus]|uniref:SigE family RNA polymerase sigma factor n=1 Tax=Tenggerimyces flavus TaxID=1708749 RepID=A0ABV7Y319_9ACTN|nr:SigE family RNA polymerase sigma factor [Tenggerimyces flavus]MBM7790512.1 RNA polymerase sigma-70 factor (sigma-E family) [Tenggerimyces flavus]